MLRREAASWIARLQSGRNPEAERAFRHWYDAHPSHRAAYDRVRESYDKAGLLRFSPAAQVPASAAGRYQNHAPYAFAAAAALLLLGAAMLILTRARPVGGTEAVMLATRVGEIRRVALGDGSAVTLDTDTRVEVRSRGPRRLALVRQGRARFEIARTGSPFAIDAGAASGSADSGVVDVARTGATSRFDVRAGSVLVRPAQGGSRALELGRGEGASLGPGGNAASGAAERGDWTRGMLQFNSTPLAEAVAQANRYSTRHILLAPQVRDLRVTGAFHAGDTAGLARSLAAAFRLSLHARPDGSLVLAPRR